MINIFIAITDNTRYIRKNKDVLTHQVSIDHKFEIIHVSVDQEYVSFSVVFILSVSLVTTLFSLLIISLLF